jgi:type IV secretory pathway VirB6-like protein
MGHSVDHCHCTFLLVPKVIPVFSDDTLDGAKVRNGRQDWQGTFEQRKGDDTVEDPFSSWKQCYDGVCHYQIYSKGEVGDERPLGCQYLSQPFSLLFSQNLLLKIHVSIIGIVIIIVIIIIVIVIISIIVIVIIVVVVVIINHIIYLV